MIMRTGVNYIPSGSWLHFWIDFDEERVRKDLENIKKIGADHIRAHLLWHYFQPNAGYMSTTCLKNLERFTALCEEYDIDFFLSLFTGFMSGMWFVPPWIIGTSRAAEIAEKEEYIEAEKFYIRNIASVVSDSPNFLGFDLGNELTCFVTVGPGYRDKWAREMFEVMEQCAPGKLHNNGVDHQPWLRNNGFSRPALANDGAITPLHCWCEFTGAVKRGGVLGTASTNIAQFMASLANAYALDPERKVWIQEFGIAKQWEPDLDKRLLFMDKTFESISMIDNLWGVTWWCSHDIGKEFKGYNPLEYELGLIDSDNNIKPEGEHFALLAEKYKRQNTAHEKTYVIKIDSEEEFDGWKYGDEYMKAIDKGEYPVIKRS